MIGKQPSLFKQYVTYHKRTWIIAIVTIGAVGGLCLLTWAITISVGAYRPKDHPLPLTHDPISRPSNKEQRTINGPLRLELEIEGVRLGDPAIVKRDIVFILSRRLKEAGIEIATAAPHAMHVSYSEMRGKRIQLFSKFGTPNPVMERELTGTTIQATLSLKRGNTMVAFLGQRQFHGTPSKVDNARYANRSISRVKKGFYQQDYSEFLNFLEMVNLPRKSG